MLLLSRPPSLRGAAATLVVLAAIVWDLSNRATEPFPFAASTIPRGTALSEADIEWRDVGAGTLAMPDIGGGHAAVDIASGDPITRTVTVDRAPVPHDWWAVPIDLPLGLATGSPVRLLLPSGVAVDGVVSIPAVDDVFAGSSGAVAVDPNHVGEVASAAAAGLLTVLITP